MRARFLAAFLPLLLLASPALANDVWIHIAGSVGVFRTDTRVFNPSGTRDISVTGFFYPQSGSAVSRQFTVPRRSQALYNDIVSSLFNASGLGAIRFSSSDTIIVTSRIYAATSGGTLGQFVPGLDPGAARARGLLIQLKATGTSAPGTYRTNLGFVNPNVTQTTVTVRRYGANNAEVLPATQLTLAALSVAFPVTLDPAAGDFSDAWVSYEASQPIFGFASVIDNQSTDPTFSTAFEDTGAPVQPEGLTKLYLSPILDFRLRTSPQAVSGGSLQLCLSSVSWTATLGGDMSGTTYRFSLGVQTDLTSSGTTGRLTAEIIHRRGTTETVLATTTFDTTRTYGVQTATVTGPDPTTQSGDTILLRVRRTSGSPCVAEYIGPGTDNFIEIPQTTITN